MKTNVDFVHEDQRFKLVYGSAQTIWESAEISPNVAVDALHDGVWLSKDSEGLWELATEASVAFPILEMKFQYDNRAVHSATVARGSVPAVTTVYSYDFEGIVDVADLANYPVAPEAGQYMKAVNGVLMPCAKDGSEDNFHVAIIEQVFTDRLLIIKRY